MFAKLAVGKEAEIELVNYLESINIAAKLNDNYLLRYDYDVIAEYNNKYTTFECKSDLMAKKTGNVAIEYWNSRKNEPSGILITKARWWTHKIENIIWICEVKRLISFTNDEKPDKLVTKGGDKNADLFIYKVDRFTSICRDLSTITNPEDLL